MTHESALPPRPLGTTLSDRAPGRARAANAVRALNRENEEHDRVVTAVKSGQRFYDPGLVPDDEQMYVDTGIGALYGLGGSHHLWQLAGWTLTSCVLENDRD